MILSPTVSAHYSNNSSSSNSTTPEVQRISAAAAMFRYAAFSRDVDHISTHGHHHSLNHQYQGSPSPLASPYSHHTNHVGSSSSLGVRTSTSNSGSNSHHHHHHHSPFLHPHQRGHTDLTATATVVSTTSNNVQDAAVLAAAAAAAAAGMAVASITAGSSSNCPSESNSGASSSSSTTNGGNHHHHNSNNNNNNNSSGSSSSSSNHHHASGSNFIMDKSSFVPMIRPTDHHRMNHRSGGQQHQQQSSMAHELVNSSGEVCGSNDVHSVTSGHNGSLGDPHGTSTGGYPLHSFHSYPSSYPSSIVDHEIQKNQSITEGSVGSSSSSLPSRERSVITYPDHGSTLGHHKSSNSLVTSVAANNSSFHCPTGSISSGCTDQSTTSSQVTNLRPHSTPATLIWLEANYEIAEGVCIPRSALYMNYVDFCSKNCIQPVNAASFGKIIRQQFPQLTTRRLGTRGQSRYHYYGIAVRESSLYYQLQYSRKSVTR